MVVEATIEGASRILCGEVQEHFRCGHEHYGVARA
jgi:hypothetical protein